MKVSTARMVVDFNRKYARMVGENRGEILLEQKIELLNEALDDYFVNRVRMFEVDSEARTILNPLEHKFYEPKLKKNSTKYNIYEIPDHVYKVVRRDATISKDRCGKKEVEPLIFQSDDLNSARRNPFWKSSYEWENLLADEGRKGLYLFHEGEFEITDVTIDYIRYPNELHAPSMHQDGEYVDFNNITRTEDTFLELGGYAHVDITNLAVYYHMVAVGDMRDAKLNIEKILSKKN